MLFLIFFGMPEKRRLSPYDTIGEHENFFLFFETMEMASLQITFRTFGKSFIKKISLVLSREIAVLG